MSSANYLAFDKSSERSFIYIRNRSGLNVKPWGTHALTSAKEILASTTLCFLFFEKLNNKFKILSDMPFLFSLKMMPSCHTKCFKNYNTFDDLRYILYTKKNETLWSLLPTFNISREHYLRSHYLVLICSNLTLAPDINLNFVEFCWN